MRPPTVPGSTLPGSSTPLRSPERPWEALPGGLWKRRLMRQTSSADEHRRRRLSTR